MLSRALNRLRRSGDRVLNRLGRSKIFDSMVRFQHRHAPLPLPLFDMLFRSKFGSWLLHEYGQHVFDLSYEQRDENYWLSREAIYYHLAVQRRTRWDTVRRFMQSPEIRSFLSRGDLDCLEVRAE